MKFITIVIFVLCCSSWQIYSSSVEPLLPSFPEAEGFGANTPGGRGGKILFVTTLDDYIPGKENPIDGSLRKAIETKGPRIILFKLSGTIKLKTDLYIKEPFITLAGQSAPGDGICIRDYQVILGTHDAIIRYIRFRPGDETRKEQQSLGIFGGNNSIIDHCSVSWAIDENMSAFGAYNITIQWCIISEGLAKSYHPKGSHSMGSLLYGAGGITIHHSIYANNASRNVRVHELLLDFRNNLVYNWSRNLSYTREAPTYMNFIGNYLKPGPDTGDNVRKRIFNPGDDMARVYLVDNYMEGQDDITKNNNLGVSGGVVSRNPSVAKKVIVNKPFDVPSVNTQNARKAYRLVLDNAGAILPKRDQTDLRLIKGIENGTSKIIDSPEDVGGWPILLNANPPLDSDNDGMPDSWEVSNKLNPKVSNDNIADSDGDGYMNIEEYLNGTDPQRRENKSNIDRDAFLSLQKYGINMHTNAKNEWNKRQELKKKKAIELKDSIVKALKIDLSGLPDEKTNQINLLINKKAVLELVKIPSGSFIMGSPQSEGGDKREWSQHKVNISKPFYMATTQITTAQFCEVLGETDKRFFDKSANNLPAKSVAWFEAKEYCDILSQKTGFKFRLPTEAEWEYACRAGTTTPFYTGNTITSDDQNFNAEEETVFNPKGVNKGKEMTPVKAYPPNPWGLYDMSGNQFEWCEDRAFRQYTTEEVTDPINLDKPTVGDIKGNVRVLRGGRSSSKAKYVRSAYRFCYPADIGYSFRVVMEVP